jgi:hypothetical protein
MSAIRLGLCVVSAWALAVSAAAQAPAPTLTPAADTPLGGGPYKAVMEMDPSLPGKTLYHPADLAKLGAQKLPVVIWGEGGCVNRGNDVRPFLSEIASYGYLIIAMGPIDPATALLETPRTGGPPGAGRGAAPPGAPAGGPPRVLPPPATHTRELIEALDWATGAPAQASKYSGALDAKHVAVMGWSCGGVQAIEAAPDPRFTTAVIWSSGMPEGGTEMAGGKPLTKADVLKMRAPTAYISGDETDIAWANANDDFTRLTKLRVFRAWAHGIGHGGTFRQSNGGEYGAIAVAWLNWQLKGDAKASLMFRGAHCGLCVNPRWVVSSKNIK